VEDYVGSAWLPACRLRSLPKVLPGFVAGVQGVRQTATILAITPRHSIAATNRGRKPQPAISTSPMHELYCRNPIGVIRTVMSSNEHS